MKKKDVVDAVLQALQEEFRELMRASEEAREGAGDEEMRAASQYDTQSTEANYLADGQAKLAAGVEEAAEKIGEVDFRDFAKGEAVAMGALVEVDIGGERSWFLMGPAAGGTEVNVDGTAVTVVTKEAPLGGQLLGLKEGERTESPEAEIIAVS
jgi:transcription elongation GreA/GreB family factor